MLRASDGASVDARSIIPTAGRVAVPFLTQFADFDSWELAQKLVDDLDALDAAGVAVVAVGIGSAESAREFASRTGFPSTASTRTRPRARTPPWASPPGSVARAASSGGSRRSSRS